MEVKAFIVGLVEKEPRALGNLILLETLNSLAQ
jgi:hypothetical protein